VEAEGKLVWRVAVMGGETALCAYGEFAVNAMVQAECGSMDITSSVGYVEGEGTAAIAMVWDGKYATYVVAQDGKYAACVKVAGGVSHDGNRQFPYLRERKQSARRLCMNFYPT